MTIRDTLKAEIAQELEQRKSFSLQDIKSLIDEGQEQKALDNLLYFTAPDTFLDRVTALQQELQDGFEMAGRENQLARLRFLTQLALALRSFLPRWNLQSAKRHGQAVLSDEQVAEAADALQRLVAKLEVLSPPATEKLLDTLRAYTIARFEAEEAQDPEGEALALVGGSLDSYVANMAEAIKSSHLRRISEMRADGQTRTELSNDYAIFLPYMMYLGASFVTCNPPLVDVAWVTFPEKWNPVVDNIIANHPGASDDELARQVTLEVVLDNMQRLRPIFLLSGGETGHVCFQVNPHNHADAEAMVEDALFVYEALRERQVGVPNIVFKLPGTFGGLKACRALTERGIGVTITVDFGMFQHIPFAEAIHQGQSIYSNLVEMNGRLAYPVRDELLEKLDELASLGIDESEAREAAAWAGVAVIKRIYGLLQKNGYDLGRVKTLVASLRIYEGQAYDDLPSAFLDMSEIVGTSILSVFPNVRRAFEAQQEMPLAPRQIEDPVPEEALEILKHSEIFKQAYYVADRDWIADKDEGFEPDYELVLEDESATFVWPPVNATLVGFSDSYDKFVDRILVRKQLAQEKVPG
jgi:transaldolase